MTVFSRWPALAAALSLAVPAAAGQPDPTSGTGPRGYAVQSHTPPDFKLPDGDGCSGDIARWRAVQANDYAGGNVSLKVYGQIQDEISRAATLCEAGQDAQASRLVAASKRRHGYLQ